VVKVATSNFVKRKVSETILQQYFQKMTEHSNIIEITGMSVSVFVYWNLACVVPTKLKKTTPQTNSI